MGSGYRVSFAGGVFHVTTRGNNREKIFLDEDDFRRYKTLLRRYRNKFHFKLYSYALMPNHVHLLLETCADGSISKIMHALNTAYAVYFNSKYDHVGHVFQGRFHSAVVDSETYLLRVMRYMDLNPVRAALSKRPDEYDWTSYRRYAAGAADDLVTRHDMYENLGKQDRKRQRVYREFVEEGIGQPGPAYAYSVFIGGDDFIGRMERIYGEEIWPKYRRLLDRLNALRNATLPE
ncbi:MAG: transposase [Planctomycetes bacterium]|nr:transposase [Planctomycetota bacterium]